MNFNSTAVTTVTCQFQQSAGSSTRREKKSCLLAIHNKIVTMCLFPYMMVAHGGTTLLCDESVYINLACR